MPRREKGTTNQSRKRSSFNMENWLTDKKLLIYRKFSEKKWESTIKNIHMERIEELNFFILGRNSIKSTELKKGEKAPRTHKSGF